MNPKIDPSTLKITDMRFADIDGAPKRCTLLKIYTNQGIAVFWAKSPATSRKSSAVSNSSAETRGRRAASAESKLRCGTLRARHGASPCGNFWGENTVTESASTATPTPKAAGVIWAKLSKTAWRRAILF